MRFLIPDVIQYVGAYIKGCHIHQLHSNEKPQPRQSQHRGNLNYKAMTILNMDLNVMPRSYKGHMFILQVLDEATNFMVTSHLLIKLGGDRRCFIVHLFSK